MFPDDIYIATLVVQASRWQVTSPNIANVSPMLAQGALIPPKLPLFKILNDGGIIGHLVMLFVPKIIKDIISFHLNSPIHQDLLRNQPL